MCVCVCVCVANMISFTHHVCIYIFFIRCTKSDQLLPKVSEKENHCRKCDTLNLSHGRGLDITAYMPLGTFDSRKTKSCFARWNTANDCDYRRCGGTWEIILSHTVNFSKRLFHEICTRFSGTVFNVCCGFISKSRSIHIIHLPIFSGSLHWHRGQSCVIFIYLFIFIISLLRLNKNAFGTSKHGGIKR